MLGYALLYAPGAREDTPGVVAVSGLPHHVWVLRSELKPLSDVNGLEIGTQVAAREVVGQYVLTLDADLVRTKLRRLVDRDTTNALKALAHLGQA